MTIFTFMNAGGKMSYRRQQVRVAELGINSSL